MCVYECEEVSRLCAWCMWMGVCMNVRKSLDCVCVYECEEVSRLCVCMNVRKSLDYVCV